MKISEINDINKIFAEFNGLPPLFDSHAHYTDARFDAGAEQTADEQDKMSDICGVNSLLDILFDNMYVGNILNVATNLENASEVILQAQKYKKMYAAVGIHPSDVGLYDDGPDEQMEMLEGLIFKKNENKIKAIGEIGLDYYWNADNKALQLKFFEAQLRLAEKTNMPVIIHDREAHGDVFETVCRYPDSTGVFHCFSGSAEMAESLVKRGWYISFTGTVTFANAKRVREAAAAVPLDRLLLESDCPYLSPIPFRGKTNHSGLSVYTARALAEIHGISTEQLIILTDNNAKALFKI